MRLEGLGLEMERRGWERMNGARKFAVTVCWRLYA